MSASKRRADCFTCRHFFVTWNPRWPRGCRAFGFQTRELPSSLVRETSGGECRAHEERVSPSGSRARGGPLRADSWEGPTEPSPY